MMIFINMPYLKLLLVKDICEKRLPGHGNYFVGLPLDVNGNRKLTHFTGDRKLKSDPPSCQSSS